MTKMITRKQHDGTGLRVAMVQARWNTEITSLLASRCRQAFIDSHIQAEDIIHLTVPGSYELPSGVQQVIQAEQVDAVVALGTLIKGETMHFEYIADAVTHGLMRLNLDTGTPVIFGVLACLNEAQAMKRADPKGLDHGYEWGLSAVEMALLRKKATR